MAFCLVLLRHADAEPKEARSDVHRRLTAQGRTEAGLVGHALAVAGIRPDLMLSSPATRALETAVLAAEPLAYDLQRIETEEGAYPGDAPRLLEIVRSHAKGKACIVLVGHNPGLRELGMALDSLQESWSLPKGHAAVFESDGRVEAGAFRHLADVRPLPS